MTGGMVGRGAELRAIDQLLDGVDAGPAAVVLSGEAGIGKSTVWNEGMARARTRGFTVLPSRPAATEVRLSYAGLFDLLAEAGPEDFEGLPAPQRRALDAALLRGPATDAEPQPGAVAAAFLSVLATLSGRAPALLAIDDVQWLDEPTMRVVRFAARRCTGPVAMLIAHRVEDPTDPVVDVGPAEPARRQSLHLGPLSLGALHEVVKRHTGRSLPRHTLVRVTEVSAGNPFFALELSRSLYTTSSNLAALPGSLRAAVQGRLEPLESSTVEGLRAVSALANPRVDLVERALGGASAEHVLSPAEDAGVIEIAGGAVHFTHPLLATAVYTETPPSARRSLHRRLSSVVDDIEERARHLALAGIGPDPETAAALDEAAVHARRRGAPDAAAELLEHLIALDGGNPALWVQAADDQYRASNTTRAQELLEAAVSGSGPGLVRAQALARLGLMRHLRDASPEGAALMEQAVVEADGDVDLRARTAMELCWVLFTSGRARDCPPYADTAVADAERCGGSGLIAEAIAVRTIVGVILGHGADEAALTRALELEDPDRPTPVQIQPSMIAGLIYWWSHRLDEAEATFRELRRRCLDRGAEIDLWNVDIWTVQIACAAGDVATAEQLVDDYVERVDRTEASHGLALTHVVEARFLAWVGRVEEARSAAEEALKPLASGASPTFRLLVFEALGMAELSAGNPEPVVHHSYPIVRGASAVGYGEPAMLPGVDDVVEALVMLDRPDDAEPIVDWVEASGSKPDRWWARAVGARCRGLLLAARGNLDEAEAAFEHALTAHDRLPRLRYPRARTLLAAGQCQRRRGRRRAAQDYLTEAARLFDEVGTARWADNARAELDRLGLRPGTSHELTATEQYIAELVASGMTNREAAAAALVSPKTVEAHLSRIYRKLGIRSRAELGGHVAQQQP